MAELRKDPVLNRWVIISTERGNRPYEFEPDADGMAGIDPAKDPFAAGNEHFTPPEIYAVRPEGSKPNTPGWKGRVFPGSSPAGPFTKERWTFRKPWPC